MRSWILLFAVGCVGRTQHELVQIQLEATRTALSAQEADCRTDLAEWEGRIADAEELHAEDQRKLEEASTRLEEMQKELAKHREEHALWVLAIPKPVPPEEGEEPTQVEPMFQETVEAIAEALAIRSEYRYATWRREQRQEAARDAFSGLVEDGWAELVEDGDATVLRLPVAKLFTEGQVRLSPRGDAIIDEVAKGLATLSGQMLIIRGHTDDQPHHSAEHASNWELGFDRAIVVLRSLRQHEVTMPAGAASYAGSRPIAPNDTPEGRQANNRVELWLFPDGSLDESLEPEGEEEEEAPEEEGTPREEGDEEP